MWSVQDNLALWESKLLHAKVDLGRPELGLHGLMLNATPVRKLQLLQTRLEASEAAPATLAEVVQRGSELAVTYAETTDLPIQRQMKWKISETLEPMSVTIDLVVCVQTSQLDSDPRFVITSVIPSVSWRQLRQLKQDLYFSNTDQQGDQQGCPVGVYVAQLADNTTHYTQVLLPSDELTAKVRVEKSGDGDALTSVLFSERLEKGVIRCARVRGVLSDGEMTESRALDVAEQFRKSPLPLGVK
jgi:hypothetical protein